MRGFRRAVIATVVTTTAACSSSELRWFAPPDLEDARGIVAVAHTESGPRAYVADVAETNAWRIQDEVMEDALAVDLFVYRCPIDAWLPDATALSVAESGGLPLPPASRVFSGSIDDGFEWRAVDEAPERTAALTFDYAEHARCSALETEAIVPLNRDAEPRLLVALGEDRVLVGTRDGDMYIASRDGAVVPFLPGADADGDPYVAGFRAEDGTIYLMSNGESCLARVDDDSTITRIACLPLGANGARGSWYDVDGEETASGLAVAARTHEGRVFVMTATSAEFRELDFGAPTGAGSKAGLAWAGDGRAFVAGSVPRDVLVSTNGALTREPVDVLPIDIVNGITIGREHGPLVVSNFGEVLVRASEDGWSAFGTCGIAEARVVAEAGGRAWCGGMGIVAEVGRDTRACPQEVTLVGQVMRLTSLGGRRLAMSAHVEGSAEVHFLRSAAPYATSCVE